MDFGWVWVGKSKILNINTVNIGLMPATSVCWMSNMNGFRVNNSPEMTLMPQDSYSYKIEFSPVKIGKFE